MLINPDVVTLSRVQFALTALFHFLFVPLTLGLTWILVVMETVYLITGKMIYRDMTRFWGKLLGINLVVAVITGLTLEFQFGTNWSMFSQYVGGVFGVPLALEGITAFMLEGTFFGIFFFGWDRVSKLTHWMSTVCLAIGSSLSALVILVANGWMQHPVGAHFNLQTMHMELTSWTQLWMNSDAQVRFVHTISAGYVTGAVFVLAISAWYILKGRDLAFAKRSFAIAAGFGLAAVLSVIVLGDQNGLNVEHVQPPKMAAMEGVWKTPKIPAAWNLFAIPDQAAHKNFYTVSIPGVLSLISHHNLSSTITGLDEIIAGNKIKIADGAKAYGALQKIKHGDNTGSVMVLFNKYKADLGYGLLLRQFTTNPATATPAMIQKAADSSIPNVFTLFWGFRIMVACGLFMLLLFMASVLFCGKGTIWHKRWLLWTAVFALPLPWIASEAGWIVAEVGRQPWTVYGVLPTFLSASHLTVTDLVTSIVGFCVFFGGLTVLQIYLLAKYARKGPGCLGTGRYLNEPGEK